MRPGGSKIWALLPFAALSALVPYLKPPSETPQTERRPVAHPGLLRAASGPFATTLADFYWLEAATVAPNCGAAERQRFLGLVKAIVVLDPGFDTPLRYATTLLPMIDGDARAAQDLVDTALAHGAEPAALWRHKAVLALAYQPDPEPAKVADYARRALAAGSDDAWLVELVARPAEAVSQRTEAPKRQDLRWLARHAPNPAIREAAENRLKRLPGPETKPR